MGVDLFDGWYVKMEGNDPFGWGLAARGDLRVEIHSWNEWECEQESDRAGDSIKLL